MFCTVLGLHRPLRDPGVKQVLCGLSPGARACFHRTRPNLSLQDGLRSKRVEGEGAFNST
jgi:hypothetical protein